MSLSPSYTPPSWTGPARALRAALKAVQHAICTDEVRQMNGVLVEVVDVLGDGGSSVGCALRLCATDGHRLAFADVPGFGVLGFVGKRYRGIGKDVLVPVDGVKAIVAALAGVDDDVTVCATEDGLVQVFGPATGLNVETVYGEFPDYRALLGATAKFRIVADRKALAAAVRASNAPAQVEPKAEFDARKASKIAELRHEGHREKDARSAAHKLKRVHFAGGVLLSLDALTGDLVARGRVELRAWLTKDVPTSRVVPAVSEGKIGQHGDNAVLFNGTYLLDALRAVPGKTVEIEGVEPLSPVFLRSYDAPAGAPAVTCLVMPMRA